MSVETIKHQIIFPTPDQIGIFNQVSALTGHYEDQGLMLRKSVPELRALSTRGRLVVATSLDQTQVLASAAYTFDFPQNTTEFGAWAVLEELIKHGFGKHIFTELVKKLGVPNRLIAFANKNSSPIFNKMGATLLDQLSLPDEMFEPCQTCNCKGRERLTLVGAGCVDNVYDLTAIADRLVEEAV